MVYVQAGRAADTLLYHYLPYSHETGSPVNLELTDGQRPIAILLPLPSVQCGYNALSHPAYHRVGAGVLTYVLQMPLSTEPFLQPLPPDSLFFFTPNNLSS